MGFFDKIKGAVNSVTGGAATVTIEYPQGLVVPGEQVAVKVTATSTGGEVKSKGIFVDLKGEEMVNVVDGNKQKVSQSKTSLDTAFQIAPAFVLAAKETKVFEGTFTMPGHALPSFAGTLAQHTYYIRGRVEALGNDPDSGFLPIQVGSRN
jgi:sporulation-control protein spo0M